MNIKPILWTIAPLALSAGVIWLSAQDPKPMPASATPEAAAVEPIS